MLIQITQKHIDDLGDVWEYRRNAFDNPIAKAISDAFGDHVAVNAEINFGWSRTPTPPDVLERLKVWWDKGEMEPFEFELIY